jgi:hypothetical protein
VILLDGMHHGDEVKKEKNLKKNTDIFEKQSRHNSARRNFLQENRF